MPNMTEFCRVRGMGCSLVTPPQSSHHSLIVWGIACTVRTATWVFALLAACGRSLLKPCWCSNSAIWIPQQRIGSLGPLAKRTMRALCAHRAPVPSTCCGTSKGAHLLCPYLPLPCNPPRLQSPPPLEGNGQLAQKVYKILGAEGAKEIFCKAPKLIYTVTWGYRSIRQLGSWITRVVVNAVW